MAILALALYGSSVRGDDNELSDVDLFAITDDDEYRMLVEGKINTACYPLSLALERARDGDLFILHICTEAKELYAFSGEFQQLKTTFRYKKNYSREIAHASDLAWFLVDTGSHFRNFTLLNKRIAWCVRTILIAKSAENKMPCFAASELSTLSGSPYTAMLIDGKNSVIFRPELVEYLVAFLNVSATARPAIKGDNILSKYSLLFKYSGNSMGLKTLLSIQGDTAAEHYT
jgi:hypothetical protein